MNGNVDGAMRLLFEIDEQERARRKEQEHADGAVAQQLHEQQERQHARLQNTVNLRPAPVQVQGFAPASPATSPVLSPVSLTEVMAQQRLEQAQAGKRNRNIVNHSHVLFGAPIAFSDRQAGGTWYTINYGIKRDCDTYIVDREGTVAVGIEDPDFMELLQPPGPEIA